MDLFFNVLKYVLPDLVQDKTFGHETSRSS